MPLVQIQPAQNLIREPVAPEGEHEGSLTKLEVRRRQAGVAAKLDHALGAGASLFDVAGEIERLGNQRVVGHRWMIVTEIVEGQCAGQRAGVPDFKPVGEEADFDGGMAVVIAVGNGIDDGFADGIGAAVRRWLAR